VDTNYKVTPSGRIYLEGVEISQDDREADYLTYVAWLKKGNGPGDIEEVALVDNSEEDEALSINLELKKLEERIELLRASIPSK
jgi:hypothetical protein